MQIEVTAHVTPRQLRQLADDIERAWAKIRVGDTLPKFLVDNSQSGAVYVTPDQTRMYLENPKGE